MSLSACGTPTRKPPKNPVESALPESRESAELACISLLWYNAALASLAFF
jgi:hypothetical protein